MSKNVLIVGGGAGGMTAATQLKKQCPDCRVVVIERGPYVSWAGCPTPYFISGKVSWKSVVHYDPDYFINDRKIEVLTRHEAISIDAAKRTVMVKGDAINGELPYDNLLLSSGAKAFIPPINGLKPEALPEGVFVLRNAENAKTIRDYIDNTKPQRAVVVGGGLIGMEMAESFTELGIKTTVVEKMPQIYPFLDSNLQRKRINLALEQREVELLTGTSVEGIQLSNGRISSVTLDNGECRPADIVLLSIGIRPDLTLLEVSGIAPADGKLIVDENLRTHVEHIYAIGDMVWTKHLLTGKPVYAPLGDVADKMGIVAGNVLAGNPMTFKGVIGSASTSLFEWQIARTGLTLTEAKAEGFDAEAVEVKSLHRIAGFENTLPGIMRVVFDKISGKLYGATIVSTDSASQFLDTFAVAIYYGLTIDQMFDVDYAYSPTTAVVWNPVLAAYRKIRNR